MNRILKISVSVILAVFLIVGTFSTGMATDNQELAYGAEPAAVETPAENAVKGDVPAIAAEPASEPEPEPEAAKDEGETPAQPAAEPEVEPGGDEPVQGGEEPAGGAAGNQEGGQEPEIIVPELKELKLDAGDGYTLASDTAFLK